MRLMEENTAEYKAMEAGRTSLQIAFAHSLSRLRADRAAGRDLDGDRRCRPHRAADPAVDRRCRQRRVGQYECHRAGARRRWRRRQPVAHLQQDDCARSARQRDEILEAKDEVDDRRRFIEAVLSGVTAAVIGVEEDGAITIANPSAESVSRPERRRAARPEAGRCRAGDRRGADRGRRSRYRSDYPQADQLVAAASERTLNVQVTREEIARRQRIPRSSRSTTSPIW